MISSLQRQVTSQLFRWNCSPLSPACGKSFFSSSSSSSGSGDEILFEEHGNKAVITLNRPKALNSLNLSMVHNMYPQLCKWEVGNNMKMVILKGAGDKAFCAGGDVRAIVEEGKNSPLGKEFFREEYKLNKKIGSYGIPYISLIDGICMGGGVGLSVHGSFRVVTEKTVFAMPETLIGFFPDVGASHFLPRLQGKLGLYLAMTGRRLTGLDILKAGIATHFVSSKGLKNLYTELLLIDAPDSVKVSHVLAKHQEQWIGDHRKEFSLKAHLGRINSCFSASTVEEIFDKLSKNSPWTQEVLKDLQKMSPTSLKITFEMYHKGAKHNLGECLKMEYRVAQHVLNQDDFFSGVTARLITKTNAPVWNPAKLEDVTPEMVEAVFKPIPGSELTF